MFFRWFFFRSHIFHFIFVGKVHAIQHLALSGIKCSFFPSILHQAGDKLWSFGEKGCATFQRKIRQVQAKVLADRSSRWCSRHHQNRRSKMIQNDSKRKEMMTFKVVFHWASHAADTPPGCNHLRKRKASEKFKFISFATSKTKMIRVLVQRGNSLQLRSSLVRFGTACCPKGAQHSKTCRFRRVPRFTVVGTRSIIGVLKVVSCFFKFDFLPCIDTFNKVLVKNMVRL